MKTNDVNDIYYLLLDYDAFDEFGRPKGDIAHLSTIKYFPWITLTADFFTEVDKYYYFNCNNNNIFKKIYVGTTNHSASIKVNMFIEENYNYNDDYYTLKDVFGGIQLGA